MPELPAADQAYQTLHNDVYCQAFFKVAADYGVVPQSQEEAQDMLKLAANLRIVREDYQQKQASTNRFAQINAELDQMRPGYKQAQDNQQADMMYRRVAADLANDPAIFNAVLSLKVAEAEQIAAQYN